MNWESDEENNEGEWTAAVDAVDVNGDSGQDEAWEDVENEEDWENVQEETQEREDAAENDAELDENDQEDRHGTIRVAEEDWDALNAALNAQANGNDGNKTKKEKVKRLTKAEKAQRVTERQAHMLCLLAREAAINHAINDVTLQALLRSLAPPELEKEYRKRGRDDVVYFVKHLSNWFRQEFRRLPYISAASTRFAVDASTLMDAYFNRQGHEHDMVCLFTALCRSWAIPTRYVCSLDTPTSLKRMAEFAPHFGIDCDDDDDASTEERKLNASLRAWCEVYGDQGWVHVDVVRNIVNQPKDVEKLRGRGKLNLLPHIVAFHSDGSVVDVAREYAGDWARTQLHRCNEVWWSQQLQVGKSAANPVDVEDKLPMPTSVEAFRNHPQYCLEQQLGLYEAIHPRKAVGLFKGMPVFDRNAVQTLYSAHRWLRQGRVVRADEVDKPMKRVPKRKPKQQPAAPSYANPTPFSVATAVVPEEEQTLPLYGQWQTDVYVAPPIVDGKIPKNEHGNIEIWSEAFLPAGSRHIRLARAKQVATQLGIDFAPAVVGWEKSRQGRSVPVFDGIVVCEEDVETIDDAHALLEQTLVEKAMAKRERQIVNRWALFVKKLLLRKRLRDEYG